MILKESCNNEYYLGRYKVRARGIGQGECDRLRDSICKCPEVWENMSYSRVREVQWL